MEVNVIKLENNLDYLIIDTIENNQNKYLILVNEEDKNDMCVRKIIMHNNQECLSFLDSEDELNEVLELFQIKHVRKEGNNEE